MNLPVNTVDLWRGDFGDSYHERNRFQPEHVKPLYDRILKDISLDSVLEVGCGLGHNLQAIDARVRVGVEPNKAARVEARDTYLHTRLVNATADKLPFTDGRFDLVLTCGLLIHIPKNDIRKVIEEICRVSRRYVLSIEYAFPVEEVREYRGQKEALWVRPYGKLLVTWGGMKILRWDEEDTDLHPGCSWWLCEKK